MAGKQKVVKGKSNDIVISWYNRRMHFRLINCKNLGQSAIKICMRQIQSQISFTTRVLLRDTGVICVTITDIFVIKQKNKPCFFI